MGKKILVTYASRTGTTARYAEAIGSTLRENGLEVDVIRMEQTTDLASYDAIVVGSAIRSSKWLPEALEFVIIHHDDLLQKPVGMFTVAITIAMGHSSQYQTVVAGWTAPIRAMLNPLVEGFFPGRLDFSQLSFNWESFLLRLSVLFGIFPREDRTDLGLAKTWAASLPPQLGMQKKVNME